MLLCKVCGLHMLDMWGGEHTGHSTWGGPHWTLCVWHCPVEHTGHCFPELVCSIHAQLPAFLTWPDGGSVNWAELGAAQSPPALSPAQSCLCAVQLPLRILITPRLCSPTPSTLQQDKKDTQCRLQSAANQGMWLDFILIFFQVNVKHVEHVEHFRHMFNAGAKD